MKHEVECLMSQPCQVGGLGHFYLGESLFCAQCGDFCICGRLHEYGRRLLDGAAEAVELAWLNGRGDGFVIIPDDAVAAIRSQLPD